MGKKVTYEIHGQVERNSFFRVGKALIRVEFTGGMINSTGSYPAQYSTDNPLYQQAIEASEAFRRGEIKRGKVEKTTTAVEQAKDSTPYTEVTNLQQARSVLIAEPYNCSLSDLQNKAAVKAVADEKGVSFPNWL